MNPLRLASFSLTAVSLLALGSACTSDSNPFDIKTTTPTQTAPAKIRLQLNVAATRADLSTDAEKKVSKISVYIFDDKNKLETVKADIAVSIDSPAELEATPGQKTVYAIACKSMISPSIAIGTSMTDFEATVFSSTINDLKTSNEFVMVGKSKPQMVFRSMSSTDLPASNIFEVELVRLVAKTQVKLGAIQTEDFGFTHGNGSYFVAQTCNQMRLQPNGTDVMTFESPTSGTFAGYNHLPDATPTNCVTGDFTANNCRYMSENIVSNPVAGNTTFAILALPVTPINTYTYNYGNLSASPVSGSIYTFYTVGLVDKNNGIEDFAVNPNPENNHVLTFTSKADADRYRDALNGGATSAMTVSEIDSPMRAPITEASDVNIRNFETIAFSGMAYYRINICDEEGNLKVERNKFYKITVNSIKSLGCESQEMLYPQNASADFNTSTSAMVGVKYKIAEWEEVDQGANLD